MSKSKPKTGIWLTDEPNEVYGKVMSIDDSLMPHYFEWATDLPWDEVKKINAAIAKKEIAPKAAKERLAWQITSELHSPAAADEAKAAFARQFQKGEAPEDMPIVDLDGDGQREMPIVDLLVRADFAKSKTQARQLLNQGGVKVEGSKQNLESMVPTTGEYVVQVGKRQYKLIRFR
jgi:tyrosyl-tRNA synthetase